MKAKSVKLIKRRERVPRQRRAALKLGAGPNRWSGAVRSWVAEFRERDRTESLPTFDRLFNDALSQSGNAD